MREPDLFLLTVEIDLGSGIKAKRRYDHLQRMLPRVKQQLRLRDEQDAARSIYMWQQTSGYKIAEAPHWCLDMDADTWQALSRGLRLIGSKGSSMYQWLALHRLGTYDEEQLAARAAWIEAHPGQAWQRPRKVGDGG